MSEFELQHILIRKTIQCMVFNFFFHTTYSELYNKVVFPAQTSFRCESKF